MQKYSKESLVGIFMILGLLGIGFMTIKLGNVSFLGQNTYTLYAGFNSVPGLRVGSPVNMLGLEIGRVSGMSLDQEQQLAMVAFEIDQEVQIYDDAIASIKTEGLIGDRYVEIDAGGSGDPLKAGDTISETESPLDLQELIGKYAFGSSD